jgi:hypothetical protein
MGSAGSARKADVRVAAAQQWNSSKFHVRKGCGIRIRVKPDSKWVDWVIESGPEGYDRFLAETIQVDGPSPGRRLVRASRLY